MITMTINGTTVTAELNDTILRAAHRAEIYIPTLCSHPDLPPKKGCKPVDFVYQGHVRIENDPSKTPAQGLESGCGLCVVEVVGASDLQAACSTLATEGMEVVTDSDAITAVRQTKLLNILRDHPHTCLTCGQKQGCPRTQCSANVPEQERCCPKLGNCELEKVADYVGISPATPRWIPTGHPIIENEPLLTRNYNLCISCTRCVRACRNLRGIEAIGFAVDKDGKIAVGSVAPTLKESGCKFCTACVEVCPAGAILDKDLLSKDEDLLPCVFACPARTNIPWYVRFLAQGNAEEALCVIRETVPLPGVLGRVCVRPCEQACRRGQVDEPISICALKRFAADTGEDTWKAAGVKRADTGRRVAVVGSGPAGLTAAFYLRKRGHAVTIFDANDKPGGMMRYGIPDYRLPEAVLDREIGEILALGVEFRPNKLIGKDITLARLRRDFDAIFLGTGAPLSRKVPLDGVGLPQVLWGVDFLKDTKLGRGVSVSGQVVVIGGGAVAVDVALTARRLGARQVHLACLEDRNRMPAHPWEIRDAEEEGVMIHNCWGPMEVVEQAGGVRGIRFKKCVCIFDAKGKFNPTYDDECTMVLEADTVILAIGQAADLGFAVDEGITVQGNLVQADDKTLETNVQGVFAGGDAVMFQGSIIHAIAAGRKAASAIDAYLGGTGDIGETLVQLPPLNHWIDREEGFDDQARCSTRKVPLSERTGFQEVDRGFGDCDAVREAARCLQCDLRLAMGDVQFPPEHILFFTRETVEKVPESEGVFRLMDETRKPIVIKGTDNMRELLLEYLDQYEQARYFDYEEDKMFSKRESELVLQHLQRYGEMPGAGADDDLF